jgi:tetratricopeptide (TPR) repeat protein
VRIVRVRPNKSTSNQLRRDDEASSLWHSIYEELSEGRRGLVGAVTSRAEAQVMRVACIYALLDRSEAVTRDHLNAALAVWQYCAASARYIFNPKDWRAFKALGDAYVHQGNIDEGVMNLQKAKAAAPDRLDIRQNLGAAFCNSGRHADAIVEFEELLQMDPDWNMARRCLAKSLRAVGRLDEAQMVLDEYNRRETQQ